MLHDIESKEEGSLWVETRRLKDKHAAVGKSGAAKQCVGGDVIVAEHSGQYCAMQVAWVSSIATVVRKFRNGKVDLRACGMAGIHLDQEVRWLAVRPK